MSVNQGIGTSVPEKVEKGRGHRMFFIKGDPWKEERVATIEDTMQLVNRTVYSFCLIEEVGILVPQ